MRMQSSEIREKFLKFFEQKSHGGHKIIPSSSLIPENDPSVLFTTAGMQQLKQYYTNPKGADNNFGTRNIVTVQKCIRTGDIDEVGDDTHLTFFEMLGNFSFGGYWKKEAIEYAHQFITKELGLKIGYVSVFAGDKETPADTESKEIWAKIDPSLNIKNHNRADNFWGPTGNEGPCGPTTEIYINGVEIWNIVFNEFYKTPEGKYEPLKMKGIDTGMGLERLLVQAQKRKNVFETDLLEPIMEILPANLSERDKRIIADHIRAASFIISDGVKSSNKESGYVLRRLMRTVASYRDIDVEKIVGIIVDKYGEQYPELNKSMIISEFNTEKESYLQAYNRTEVEISKHQGFTGYEAFGISSTLGARISDIVEIAKKKETQMSEKFEEEFEKASRKHQDLSRTASAGMFKGGLANHNQKTIKLHTAHHLLLAALKVVLGPTVKQRGSNITEERLRIDFLCDHKLTDEEKKKVEEWVNEKIKKGLSVTRRELPRHLAESIGAEMEFGAKYPDVVSVYFIGPGDAKYSGVSVECCGGPHVKNTGELGNFKILKEEAVAQGIRRIKAVLL